MAKIKICGLKSIEDIEFVNEANIDFAGFIFTPKSKRCIDIEQALKMKKLLNLKIKSVGVFLNENIASIKEIAERKIIDFIQLHGNETKDYIIQIKKETNLPVIKAFKADSELEYNIKNTLADYVLLDSSNGNQFGGTGKTFDYALIPKTDKPIFLAGGLNINNIENALKINPFCLDINSGVETEEKKDRNKILEITAKIRNFEKV